jgi:peroxiredoxin
MPILARAVGTRLRVVGIDERDSSGSARSFATSRGVTYPSLSDPEGELLADLPMLPQVGVPSTLFLDAHGRVAARVIGPVDARVLRRIIRQLGASR